jgi:hypothetical protein
VFVLEYIGIIDIMSKVGGLQASVMPIMRLLGPWLALGFLIQMSRVIRRRSQEDYHYFCMKFLNKVYTQLKTV